MILRRVIQHFRKQEWTAIAIDFLIVVVGVFVGIQVSNWNAANASARKADIFSARLLEDLREEAWSYESLIAYNREILVNAQRAIAALSGDAALSDEALLVSAYRATQYGFNDRKRATFDELISTGDFGLINDVRLRETAVQIFNTRVFDLILEDGRQSEYREMFRKIVPADVQQALLERCGDRYTAPGDYEAIIGSLDYECDLDLPPATLAVSASALRENDALLPALKLRAADTSTALGLLLGTNQDLHESLQAIAGAGQ